MELTYNINPESKPIPVKQQNGIGNESFFISRIGDLATSTLETIIETKQPTVIDLLDFANNTSSNNIQLYIQHYTGSSYLDIGFVNSDGSGNAPMTTRNIVDHGIEIFNVKAFDTVNNKFKFSLNQKLYFPKGVRIQVENKSAATVLTTGLRIYGRYY